MKVIVTSPTGIGKEALIDKDSGVLEFKDGEISHVLFEKQMQKTIHILKDAPKKEEPKKEEVKPDEPKKEEPSEQQSKPIKKVKVK